MTNKIRNILAAHTEAQRTGIPVDEVLEMRVERAISRRGLLKGSALAAGAVVGAGLLRPTAARAVTPSNSTMRVAIVGGGLAGVRAAHWLWTVKGLQSTIYEANTRAGGRCFSQRGYFFPDVITEHGGAFINDDHPETLALVKQLGLTLRPVTSGNDTAGQESYWINNRLYTYDAANKDWGAVAAAFQNAGNVQAPFVQTYDNYTQAGRILDNMTVDQWLDKNIPGGSKSNFGQLMEANVMAESGAEMNKQSALNLIYLLYGNDASSLDPISGGGEHWTIDGGNDLMVSTMLAQLPTGTIQYGQQLTAVKQNANGTVTLTFANGTGSSTVVADRAVMALPFMCLRDCDLSATSWSSRKIQAINQMTLGTNEKLQIGVSTRRPWLSRGFGGSCYSSLYDATNPTGFGFQCAWDDTADSGLTHGVLCHLPGGDFPVKRWNTGPAFGPAADADVQFFLGQVEKLFPGTTAAYTGVSYRSAWHLNPWAKGGYTNQQPGQYTTLFGVEAKQEGSFTSPASTPRPSTGAS